MFSEWLGEMFEGDSADTCAGKSPIVGGQANGQACADGERGPPSVRAEIFQNTNPICLFILETFQNLKIKSLFVTKPRLNLSPIPNHHPRTTLQGENLRPVRKNVVDSGPFVLPAMSKGRAITLRLL